MSEVRRADPHVALQRALDKVFARYDIFAECAEKRTRPWASATFIGAMHTLIYRSNSSVRRLSRVLGRVQFGLPDHVVGSIELIKIDDGFAIEALTLQVD
jgi:hypothetical protein